MPHIATSLFDAFVFGFGAGLGLALVNGVISLFQRGKQP